MKKTNHFLFLLGIILSFKTLNAQVSQIVVSPQTQCYTAGNNSSTAYIYPGNPAASSYSWAISSPSGCVGSITSFSNGAYTNITYPCCGVYTITAFAFSPSGALVGTYTKTATVTCVSGIQTSALPGSSICAGSAAIISASGANSYTWSTGATTPSIVVSPSVTTCYTVVAITSGGCSVSGIKCITVSPSLVVSVSGTTFVCAGSGATLTASGASSYTWVTGMGTFTGSTIVLSPSVTTCYTVTGSNGPGCSGYGAGCITVNPNSGLGIGGNFNICQGQSTILYATGGSSLTWQPGGSHSSTLAVSPGSTTCYTLTGLGCSSFASAVRCVTVNNTAALSVSGNTLICAGTGATLTASGATNYTWTSALGTFTGSTIVLTPSANICFSLVGTIGGGCTGFIQRCIIVAQSTTNLAITGNFNICFGSSTILSASGASSYTWLPSGSNAANILVNPSSTTCYTLLGTNCAGAALPSAVRCITVGSAPVVSVSGNTTICGGQGATLTASGATSYTWTTGMGTFTGSTIVLSPSVTTCYTVTGSNGPGCSGYGAGCIIVNSAGPSITVGGNTSFCAGGTTTLFANGASTYTWLPGNLTGPIVAVSPSISTCYTIVGTNGSGCVGLGYKCVQLTPAPVITTGSSVFCAGTSGLLQASGANTYTWLPFGLTGSSISITPSVSTCYTVIGSNGTGCTSSAVGCFSVIPSPAISVFGTATICAGASVSLSASGAGSYTWYPSNTVGSGIVVSPSVSTCYTVIGTNGMCTSKVVKCITVQTGANINVSGANIICAGSGANLLASGANTYTWNTGSNSPFITVSPSVSACYTVMGTTSGGCVGSAVKCLSVQAAPSVTVSGPGSICAGSNALLVASGASSYVWSTGGTGNTINVFPLVTTSYTVSGNNGSNCSGSAVITVTVSPRPTVQIVRTDSILNHDSTICAGNPVHLMAFGTSTYTWSNGATSSNILVTPLVTTSYTVVGTNSFGCTNTNLITLHVSACTGISKNAGNIQIVLYPNPSTGVFRLRGDGINTVNYSVFDITGRELIKGGVTNSKNLDLSNYANGTYIIRFESGASSAYKKLIVEK